MLVSTLVVTCARGKVFGDDLTATGDGRVERGVLVLVLGGRSWLKHSAAAEDHKLVG